MSNKQKSDLALGVKRVPGGWVVTRYEIKDNKILATKQSEPDNRALVLERFLSDISVFWETNE